MARESEVTSVRASHAQRGDDLIQFPVEGHLRAAPDGIGAALVWPRADGTGVRGADGTGVSFIDMELGWTLDHVDLPTRGLEPLYGRIIDMSRQHGTAVLGVIAAKHDSSRCRGIVPNLQSVQVVSYEADKRRDYAHAMARALEMLEPGDVFLLEAQLARPTPLPLEAQRTEFELIRNATAQGIIIIEPAGNNAGGGVDLARYADNLNPDSPSFEDSGAIVVGAGSAHSPHTRVSTSNFGTRVNCYAWGENVATLNSNVSAHTHSYRSDFGGTSAAAAIIAGAALAVQGMAEQNLGCRLTPLQLRELLSDRHTGTLSAGDLSAGGAAVDLIGVMPDVYAISRVLLARQGQQERSNDR